MQFYGDCTVNACSLLKHRDTYSNKKNELSILVVHYYCKEMSLVESSRCSNFIGVLWLLHCHCKETSGVSLLIHGIKRSERCNIVDAS